VEPNIALATLHDIDELARLRWQMHLEDVGEPTESWETFSDGFAVFAHDAISGEMWNVWVAEDMGRLVGTMWLQLIDQVPAPDRGWGRAPIGYLTNAYVEPAYRDGAVASSMLDQILAWCDQAAFDVVICWAENEASALFERAGFAPDPKTRTFRPGGDRSEA
jgi:GNAT superfamily N-acetyltransferase